MKIKKITREAAAETLAAKTSAGKWSVMFEEALKTGIPFVVSDITRGQVASIYRMCKDRDWDYRADYKELEITVIPPAVEA